MADPIPAVPAKRRACTTCTAAKAKCRPRQDNVCERCARLKRPCVFLDMPSRRLVQPPADAGQLNALERKVDTLVKQLAVLSKHQVGNPDTVISEISTPPAPLARDHGGLPSSAAASSTSGTLTKISPAAIASKDGISDFYDDVIERGLVSFADAKERINLFQSDYVPSFPYTPVPKLEYDADIIAFRRRRPLFLLAILAVTELRRHEIRHALSREFRQRVGSLCLDEGGLSLDHLQGLLVYSAWHHLFRIKHTDQLFMFLQICVATVYHLNLEPAESALPRPGFDAEDHHPSRPTAGQRQSSSEEKRALLGTYWLSAVISHAFRKSCDMKFTKYMNDCLDDLVSRREYDTDVLLRRPTMFQHLTCQISASLNHFGHTSPANGQGGGTPFHFLHQHFLQRIESLIEGAGLSSLEACFLHSWLEEPALRDDAWIDEASLTAPPSEHPMPTGHGAAVPAPVSRVEALWRLLKSNTAFLEALLALPADELPRITTATSSQVCYLLFVQARTTTLLLDVASSMDKGGGASARRQILARSDYLAHCSQLADHFDSAAALLGGGGSAAETARNPMTVFAHSLRTMALSYSKYIQQGWATGVVALSSPTTDGTVLQPASQTTGPDASTITMPPYLSLTPLEDVQMAVDGSIGPGQAAEPWPEWTFPSSFQGLEPLDRMVWEGALNDFRIPFNWSI